MTIVKCPNCKGNWKAKIIRTKSNKVKCVQCSQCDYVPTQLELAILYNTIQDQVPPEGTKRIKFKQPKRPHDKTPECKGNCSTKKPHKCVGDCNNHKKLAATKKNKPLTKTKVLKSNEISQKAMMNYINNHIDTDNKKITKETIEAFNALANLQLAWAAILMIDEEIT